MRTADVAQCRCHVWTPWRVLLFRGHPSADAVQSASAANVMVTGKQRDRKSPDRANGEHGVTLDRAFAELRPAMFALAYRITGNRADAEEIVQDAFVRLHDAAPVEAVRSVKAYLATITARLSLNRLRDQRTRR